MRANIVWMSKVTIVVLLVSCLVTFLVIKKQYVKYRSTGFMRFDNEQVALESFENNMTGILAIGVAYHHQC